MTSADNWIGIKQAVPSLGERVLLTDGRSVAEGYRCDAGYRRHYGERWDKSLTQYGETFITVTHWQPLPKPPRR